MLSNSIRSKRKESFLLSIFVLSFLNMSSLTFGVDSNLNQIRENYYELVKSLHHFEIHTSGINPQKMDDEKFVNRITNSNIKSVLGSIVQMCRDLSEKSFILSRALDSDEILNLSKENTKYCNSIEQKILTSINEEPLETHILNAKIFEIQESLKSIMKPFLNSDEENIFSVAQKKIKLIEDHKIDELIALELNEKQKINSSNMTETPIDSSIINLKIDGSKKDENPKLRKSNKINKCITEIKDEGGDRIRTTITFTNSDCKDLD